MRQKAELQKGIPTDKAREIVKLVKGTKIKVQTAIQGDQLRVTGQEPATTCRPSSQLLKETDLGIDMQFTNYR